MSKLTVLFVDDEAMLLDGLRRALREMRDEWTMLFASSGREALKILDEQPIDVVVSDMRMPGMDGRELLLQVKARHPRTARLMLSGHADRTSLMEAVGCVHQFMAKPTDVAVLRDTIRRTLELRAVVAEEANALRMASVDSLPAMPESYTRIVRCVQDPEAGIKDAAAIIARDPGLTGAVVKVANSAFFGPPRPVTTVERACSFLGMEIISGLVLSNSIVAAHPALFASDAALACLPEHSLRVATLARAIAVAEELGEAVIEPAFIAGLLHDVGRLAIAMQAARSRDSGPSESSQRPNLMDRHPAIGAYLAGLWGFPDPIVEAIAWHHDAGRLCGGEFALPQVIYIANLLAEHLEAETPEAAGLDPQFIARSGIATRWPSVRRAAARISGEAEAAA